MVAEPGFARLRPRRFGGERQGGGSRGNHGFPRVGYREWLPVVEIDGERAFVYYVDEDRLLHKVSRR
jgi:hypothetical protein